MDLRINCYCGLLLCCRHSGDNYDYCSRVWCSYISHRPHLLQTVRNLRIINANNDLLMLELPTSRTMLATARLLFDLINLFIL